ncbi:MAG: class II fumarate hydratase, partial [Planctomycetales bacterium]|nr:class II fumarate hydratase [Planctomycetales bacterium]
MSTMRTERDSMGDVQVPAEAYYGAQTQRAVENFPVSGWPLPPALVHAMGLVKYACAVANRDLGKLTGSGKNPLTDEQVDALMSACKEVAAGKHDGEFPIDVFQTGSGTSSNMNVNEVISNRAIEMTGGDRFAKSKPIHPNDHVNMGQSTNDTFPTAIHVAVGCEIKNDLIPALSRLAEVLRSKSQAWDKIIKIGRTHLMDATPLRLGQEFGGFARQLELSIDRARAAIDAVLELPVGGTAVGSGINTHPEFGRRTAEAVAQETGIAFVEAVDHFEANAQRDGLVACHGLLRTVAVTLFNVSNNIRWLGSGPRCGFFEVVLPDRQPGSSIMPGKVNPVMCESLMQVAARVMGNDQTLAVSGAA